MSKMSSFLLISKHLLKPNLLNHLKTTKTLFNTNGFGFRYLFTNEVLGIDGYLHTKERISTQFSQLREKFFARMEDNYSSDSKMIFTEDLKNIVFLTEKDDQELQLMSDAIKKFHSQNQALQFGTFVFGPLVMRLLHHLSEWELALSLFKDPALKGFFNQIKSAVILMNCLFINGKYEEVMDVFYFMQNELQLESKYPRDCLLLVMSAAYKINSEESFNKALDIMKNARETGVQVSRKTVCLFAALALNQNQPNIALEVMSLITQTNYITVRNLRLIALLDMNRFDDLFISLKLMINRDAPPESRRQQILEETFKKMKEKFESINDKQIQTEFSQIERALVEGNHISTSTLEEIMLTPVVMRTDSDPYNDRQQRGFRNPAIQQNYRRYDRQPQRHDRQPQQQYQRRQQIDEEF